MGLVKGALLHFAIYRNPTVGSQDERISNDNIQVPSHSLDIVIVIPFWHIFNNAYYELDFFA